MEKKESPKTENVYLVSVKSKTSNLQGKVFVVSLSSLDSFIKTHLSPDFVLLIDTIETYGMDI